MKSPASIKLLRLIVLAFGLFMTLSGNTWATTEKPACEFTKKYLAADLKLKVECNDNFLHYCSGTKSCSDSTRKASSRTPKEIKVAGFNVYNLGMEADFTGKKLTPFKDVELLATVINQWDVVAAIELKHFDAKDFRFNQHITKFISELEERGGSRPVYADKKDIKAKKPAYVLTAEELKKYYRTPSYLKLI